jgi:hypothetical protein
MRNRSVLLARAGVVVFAAVLAAGTLPAQFTLTPDMKAALDRISANSLSGHVSFLASDTLAGRDTPSIGLDVAAEYIASQFRRAGLEPAGDDGYFETANYVSVKPNYDGFEFSVTVGGQTLRIPKEHVALPATAVALDVPNAGVVKLPWAEIPQATAEQVNGKVLLSEMPGMSSLDEEGRRKFSESARAVSETLARLKPALAVLLVPRVRSGGGGMLREASAPGAGPAAPASPWGIQVADADLAKAYAEMKPGAAEGTATFRCAAPVTEPVKLKNVIGVLRGSDPVLKDTYVLVTAHYDHLGVRPQGQGDRIYNGANDDASGTATVVELALALGHLQQHPKRSIVFMTYFGEEKGGLGSQYYGRHPVFPIAKTVADMNLEQLGRTDDSSGAEIGRASITGFDFSDVGATFEKAGELTGVTVFKDPQRSDAFFARSDNIYLANLGIPAHTLCVAYVFPDYHQPGDEWQKLDYPNMAKIDRMIGTGLLMIADNPVAPKWNAANPKTEAYRKAAEERQ